jgi:hypothetical protein
MVHTQLPGNSTHLPLLDKVVTQDFCFQFFINGQGSFSSLQPSTMIRGLVPATLMASE